MTERTRVVGYCRVSTTTQAESGAGMDAQRSAIQREVEHRGWQLVEMFEDNGLSGRNVNGRPGLQAALAALDSAEADLLLCARSIVLAARSEIFRGCWSAIQSDCMSWTSALISAARTAKWWPTSCPRWHSWNVGSSASEPRRRSLRSAPRASGSAAHRRCRRRRSCASASCATPG